jgi:hypothetical protein
MPILFSNLLKPDVVDQFNDQTAMKSIAVRQKTLDLLREGEGLGNGLVSAFMSRNVSSAILRYTFADNNVMCAYRDEEGMMMVFGVNGNEIVVQNTDDAAVLQEKLKPLAGAQGTTRALILNETEYAAYAENHIKEVRDERFAPALRAIHHIVNKPVTA